MRKPSQANKTSLPFKTRRKHPREMTLIFEKKMGEVSPGSLGKVRQLTSLEPQFEYLLYVVALKIEMI